MGNQELGEHPRGRGLVRVTGPHCWLATRQGVSLLTLSHMSLKGGVHLSLTSCVTLSTLSGNPWVCFQTHLLNIYEQPQHLLGIQWWCFHLVAWSS